MLIGILIGAVATLAAIGITMKITSRPPNTPPRRPRSYIITR